MSDKQPLKVRQADPSGSRMGILLAIHDERQRQETNYPGLTCASPLHTETDRVAILLAEVGEVTEEAKLLRWPNNRCCGGGIDRGDEHYRERLRTELLQVGAIVVAWIESLMPCTEGHDWREQGPNGWEKCATCGEHGKDGVVIA